MKSVLNRRLQYSARSNIPTSATIIAVWIPAGNLPIMNWMTNLWHRFIANIGSVMEYPLNKRLQRFAANTDYRP